MEFSNPFINELKKYGLISSTLETAILKKIKRSVKKKNSHFLKEGQIISSIFVIEKGCVKAYFNKGNKEVISWFGFENEVLGSILPIFEGKPSVENIQFLEDSVIHSISVKDFNSLYELYPEFNLIGRKLAENYCIVLEERIVSFQTESAEKRYQSLIKSSIRFYKELRLVKSHRF